MIKRHKGRHPIPSVSVAAFCVIFKTHVKSALLYHHGKPQIGLLHADVLIKSYLIYAPAAYVVQALHCLSAVPPHFCARGLPYALQYALRTKSAAE